MAIKRQSSAAAWNGDIGELFHLLTDAEREAVWNVGAQWFATWVAIGMKSAEVEQSIKSIRG